jgi:hypothetical protein
MLIANTEDLEFEDYEVYLQTIPGLDAQYNQAHSRSKNCKKVSVFYGAGL